MATGSTTSVRDLANDHAPVSDFLGCDPLTVDPSTMRITPQQMGALQGIWLRCWNQNSQ